MYLLDLLLAFRFHCLSCGSFFLLSKNKRRRRSKIKNLHERRIFDLWMVIKFLTITMGLSGCHWPFRAGALSPSVWCDGFCAVDIIDPAPHSQCNCNILKYFSVRLISLRLLSRPTSTLSINNNTNTTFKCLESQDY